MAPWHDCAPCHSQPDGAPSAADPPSGPLTSPPTRAKSVREGRLLPAPYEFRPPWPPRAAINGPVRPPHAVLIPIYWDLAWPVRLPLPISPCVNASANPFGGFGVTRTIVPAGKRTDGTGRVYRLQAFQFDGAVCWVCPLRSQCIAAQGRQGRRVQIHPQEGMLQQARALQQSADYDEYRARRVVVEHRLARLVQLGIRQARYFGKVKTKFQLYLAATVANLTLVLGKIGLLSSTGGGAAGHRVVLNVVPAVIANAAANLGAVRLGQLWSLILLTSALPPKYLSPTKAFRPAF